MYMCTYELLGAFTFAPCIFVCSVHVHLLHVFNPPKTLSKPSLRRPVTSCPVLTAPGTRPYASAMATRTAGAIEMTHSLRSSPTLAAQTCRGMRGAGGGA
eukprot:365244-Chlamydomonas_euryale.AAC.11